MEAQGVAWYEGWYEGWFERSTWGTLAITVPRIPVGRVGVVGTLRCCCRRDCRILFCDRRSAAIVNEDCPASVIETGRNMMSRSTTALYRRWVANSGA